MIVTAGEGDTDLNDLWAFSFIHECWYKPKINGGCSFLPKRFHTANPIQKY